MTMRAACVLGLGLLLTGSPAAAQWINYPTPGMPRTADGKPNLGAPAPRAADGKPDLSGVWSIGGLGATTNITNVEMLPWAQAVYKQRLATFGHDDPFVTCLPEGPRTSLAGFEPLRIIQTPALIAIVYETGQTRLVYLDGRPLPDDPTPTWMGYSIGRWEGDTLVVQTAGYNDKTWLDFNGHPHSEALRITERFRRTDFGHIQLAMTFDDPKTYVKPFTVNFGVTFQPDTDLIESICLENEKSKAHMIGLPSDVSEVKVAPEVLARYVGTYEGPLGTWKVSRDGARLAIEIADGGGPQPLVAQSATSFSFQAIGGVVAFVADAKGTVSQFVATIVEGEYPFVRK
jgi:hypothetical protein